MRTRLLTLFVCASIASAWGQVPSRTFDWVRASVESVQLDPADYHTARVYRPGPDGGNMHVIIEANQPVTLAMTGAEEWTAAQARPETWGNLEYRCLREHVTSTTYECHLLPSRPMVLVIHDERTPERAIVQGIGAILGKGGARMLVAPNDVAITYHSWSCVANCVQPEFQWVRLVKEKYELSAVPKLYSILTPEQDGQKLWMKIKAPVPMTLGVLPAALADQIYDKPDQLGSALAQTSCKQRGVQTMEFDCFFNLADGPQSLLVVPDERSHKKAEIEVQTYKCVENCELLGMGVAQP
ncbi:MAG TPA: hypothetical protein VNY29_12525 [Terriglobales bacterium]|jgi:hypothetical protein|nr:hypothetical protein [Terriglobales bacterium]